MVSVITSHVMYLEDFLGFKGSRCPQDFDRCLDVMKRYERNGNKWWIKFLGDDVQLAYYQLKEPVLLIPKEAFRSGIRKVVGHDVYDSDLSFKNEKLKDEFYEKYPVYVASLSKKGK